MNTTTNPSSSMPSERALIVTAFAAVYLIWGSTYLGIRIAIETLPPMLMAALRFLVAGVIMYGVVKRKTTASPSRKHWAIALLTGALLLAGGNGGVTWAEQHVPSNVAALMIAVTPMWIALMDWLRPGGVRPTGRVILGILVGFCGMLLLVGQRIESTSELAFPWELGWLLFASISWAAGSLCTRYLSKPKESLLAIAMQMIAGGGVMLVISGLLGEWGEVNPGSFSLRSLVAFVYLTLIGSLIGFTAYSWLLKKCEPSKVATYAYVNPVVAVFLGWAVLDETLSLSMGIGASIIVLGVVIVTTPTHWFRRKTSILVSSESEVPLAKNRI